MHFVISETRCLARCFLSKTVMSSTVLLSLLRCGRSTIARQTFLTARSSPETSTASGQVNLHMFFFVSDSYHNVKIRIEHITKH